MDEKRFEEIKQVVADASVGISPYGTSPSYGSESGKDPTETLGFLNQQEVQDDNWKAGKALYNGLLVQGGRGIIGALKMARDYNVYTRREKDPTYQPMEEGMAILDNAEKSSALQRYDVKGNSTLGQFGLDLTEGAGQLAGQIAVTAATGGAGGLAFMGTQIAGNQYLDLRNEGVEVPRAAIASLGNAGPQAALEQLPLGKIMKAVPAGSTLRKKGLQILESALTEGATEFLQQYPEEMANIYAMNKGKNVREMAAEFDNNFVEITKDAAYSGLLGALLGGGGSSINVALERNAHNAQVEALQGRIEAERKSGVNPDFIEGTVNTNLQGTTLAIDGETLLQYAQTKNTEEVAQALGVEVADIAKAAADGLSIDVLQGNFEATELKMPGFLDAVRDDITFSDGGYSANKEKYQRLLQNETEQIAARDTDLQQQLDTMYNNMRDVGVNKQTATAMTTLYRSRAVAANPYDPAQYFRDHPLEFRRDGNAVYGQAAMKRQSFDSMEDFAAELVGKPTAQASKIGNWVKSSKGGEFIIPGSNYLHVQNGNHPLTVEQWQAVVDNIESAEYAQLDNVKGRNGGKPVQIKIDTPLGKAGVSMEVLPNGKVLLVTAVFNNDAAIDNWIKNKKSSQTLGIESEGQQNRLLGSLSLIDIIKDKLGIVKEDTYNQSAFHGSPHKFKKFDLGAIGTGEGNQAHGWGLYFAKNRKIAENYKDVLGASVNTIDVDGVRFAINDDSDWYNTKNLEVVTYGSPMQIALTEIETTGNRQVAIKKLKNEIQKREDSPTDSAKDFVKNAKAAVNILTNKSFELNKPASVYEVDIPENDVLLDEQKLLSEQPAMVKKASFNVIGELDIKSKIRFISGLRLDEVNAEYRTAIKRYQELNSLIVAPWAIRGTRFPKILSSLLLKYGYTQQDIENFKKNKELGSKEVEKLRKIHTAEIEKLGEEIESLIIEPLKTEEGQKITGGEFYNILAQSLQVADSARVVSETLNKYGVKGITYYGQEDGRCFVVFDDQAIKVINKYNQQANSVGENKGGIGWAEDGTAIINLFNEADASTVIHESGHYFVENLGRDVNEGRASEQQQKDWQTMLSYAGITNDEWQNMSFEERRPAHERWAEGFETYMMEGKAPSRELRSVFKRFADWLKAIYENYKRNANAVPLNDDVRQVFDRMLASEEDIKEMERVNGYFSKMPKVITDSLSESSKKRIADYMLKAEDKAVELLTKQSLVNFTGERKERIDAFRADVLPQVRDELTKSPLYSAAADVEEYTMDTHQKAKTVARRYLNEGGKEFGNWREELEAVQGDIRDRLMPIMDQLRSGMNQGVAFVRDPETGKYIRHSNNDYWYSIWYKQHGRMLTQQDLRQLAYEVYTGERSDVLPGFENNSEEAAEYFATAKTELDELMRREQELLEQKDDVSKYRYRGLKKEDRITFDMLAERYNYSSGSELAQTIMKEPTLERAITLQADAMVQEAFPDIYKERQLAEAAAREAFYNDDTGLVIGLEQQLIEDKAAEMLGQERSMDARARLAQARRQQANLAAHKELTEMSVSDAVRTDRFITAERKAAAQAATALSKEDYAAALRYKNIQALNHAKVRESLRLKDTVNQYRRYINRQFGAKKETWLNDDHFAQAAAIMQRMGYKRKDYDPYMRMQSLADYAATMQDLYDNVDIAGWILNEENSLRNPMQMTFDQFEDVVNALKNIKAIAKMNRGENMLGGAMDYVNYTTDAASNLKMLKSKFKPVLGERQTPGRLETYMASMKTSDNLFEGMDDSHYGFFSKSMGTAIKHGNDSEANHVLAFEERTTQAYREWLPDKAAEEAAVQKVWYDELGASADKHTLTKMLMNLGNEGNARVLCTTIPAGIAMDSELWIEPGAGVTRDEAIEQTKANLLEFLGKVLTKEDIKYAQAKVDIAGMYWDEMAALDRRTKGFAPRKVEALPVEMMLAGGETVVFRGGYFPLMRDRQLGSAPQGQVPIADTDPQQGRNIRTLSTSNGNLKERVQALYPIDLSNGAEFKVMENNIHDLCWRETMSDFRRLFNDEAMYGLMKEKLGIAQLQAFREMLEKAAQPYGTASADLAETALSQTASWLRRKTVNAAIMLNFKTAVQNFGNIFVYGRVVEGFGYSDVLAGLGNWQMNLQSAGDYKSMNELIMKKSAFMRERSELPDITLRDLRDEGKMNALERETVKWGTKMLVYTDNLTAKPMWLQAYMKKINAGAGEQEAVDFADMVIRRTLGSSRITDVSSLQRGSKLFKLFTTFQGFFNTQFNQWIREANIDLRLLREGHTKEAALNITTFVAAKYLLFCLVNLALAFEDPREEDEDGWKKINKELLHYPLSLMGPLGQAGNALMDKMTGMKSYGYRMSAIQSTIDSGLRAGSKIHRIIEEDDPLTDLIEPAAGVAGTAAGVPQQLNKLFFNAYDYLYNDMEPQFGDIYRRRPKSER